MQKCDFNKIALDECSHVNLLHIVRTRFLKNISGWLIYQRKQKPLNPFSISGSVTISILQRER